ncbi:MAG TPA: hypothetical protein VHB20_07560 [Verrucomicrobiae bacterium]|jgi:hypothetical protein|nr:hypothetical protein [Verrucomicrobiae bacterium]
MSTSDILVLVGAVIGVFAIFIAIQFGFLAFYFKVSERYIERQKSETEKILSTDFHMQKSSEISGRAWVANTCVIGSVSCILAHLIHESYGRSNPHLAQKMIEELHETEVAAQKPILELLVLMNDQARRNSAMRELSEDSGDLYTLNLFAECLERGAAGDRSLQEAHAKLLTRLSGQLNQSD